MVLSARRYVTVNPLILKILHVGSSKISIVGTELLGSLLSGILLDLFYKRLKLLFVIRLLCNVRGNYDPGFFINTLYVAPGECHDCLSKNGTP